MLAARTFVLAEVLIIVLRATTDLGPSEHPAASVAHWHILPLNLQGSWFKLFVGLFSLFPPSSCVLSLPSLWSNLLIDDGFRLIVRAISRTPAPLARATAMLCRNS